MGSTIRNALGTAYEVSCPKQFKKKNLKIVHATPRAAVRRLFNRIEPIDEWNGYMITLTKYNGSVRDAKWDPRRAFCDGIENMPARLHKFLIKETQGDVLIEAESSWSCCFIRIFWDPWHDL